MLDVIGRGTVTTKFQLLAAASNMLVGLVTTCDGRLHDWKGASALFVGEVFLNSVGVVLVMVVLVTSRPLQIQKFTGMV